MYLIYHNPKCSTSRKVLQAIRDAGHEPQIVDYLKTGWARAQLIDLFTAAGVTPKQALRTRNTQAVELGLTRADDDTIIAAMIADPVLVERPFVTTPKGTRLCRPPELVQEIL